MHSPHKQDDWPRQAGALYERLRARSPRIHCITNAVAQNFTANALLAAGCVPSMTLSAEEIGGFVAGADALLVNLGTLDPERREATGIAVEAARESSIPWALDPVFVDRSKPRAEFARTLITRAPNVVRLNRAEFSALAGAEPSPESLAGFARGHNSVIALSGATDWICDGKRLVTVGNGHPLMARVTAIGCATSALVAAALAVEPDALRAAAAALAIVGLAGEIASAQAQGPGSFATAILDALYTLDAASIAARAKVT